MGCMSSKQEEVEPVEVPRTGDEIFHISWPTKSYRNPSVLPASLAIGYPYSYPDGCPNSLPPFPIPDEVINATKTGLIYCEELDRVRRPLQTHTRSHSSMEKAF